MFKWKHVVFLMLGVLTVTASGGDEMQESQVQKESVEKESATEIFDKSVVVGLMPSWEASAELLIKTRNREKLRRGMAYNLKRQSERGSLRLFRFSEPVDVAGVSFLIHENGANNDDIWMYLPSLSKTRRILSSSKHDSFMGSDFSYADLMAVRTEEYKHEFINDTECADSEVINSCYIIQSTVISDDNAKSLGYRKMLSYIAQSTFLPYQIEYFDEKGRKFKVQQLFDFIKDEDSETWIAKKRKMENLDDRSSSMFTLFSVETGLDYDKAMFSMKRMRTR